MCAVFLTEGEMLFLKGSCPMTYERLLDVMDRFLNLRESVRTPARIRPYPPGHFATGFSHRQSSRSLLLAFTGYLCFFGHFGPWISMAHQDFEQKTVTLFSGRYHVETPELQPLFRGAGTFIQPRILPKVEGLARNAQRSKNDDDEGRSGIRLRYNRFRV